MPSAAIDAVARINLWRFRYILLAVLLVNGFLFQHFLLGRDSINPIASTSIASTKPTTPSSPSSDSDASPTQSELPSLQTNILFVPPPESSGSISLHDYDFNGEYVGWPLKRVCNETTFTPGLVYICDNNSGGIGNIRNFLLTCIRYAIEAGATGLILPKIQRRSEENLGSLFTSSFQPFSYFFDETHFRTVMKDNCPRMIIYDKLESIPHYKQRKDLKAFYPKDLKEGGTTGDGPDERGWNRHLDQYRDKHDEWLHKEKGFPAETSPSSVTFRWAVFFEWPIYRDGPEFATTFGDILRIRKDIDDLAAITIGKLTAMAKGEPDGEVNREKIDTPYLGVHLRTEGDSLGFWPNFDVQSAGYLLAASKHGLKIAYIATGNATEGHKFGTLALSKLGMNVYGKTDLLKGRDLKKLKKLSWDQQALVDFLVLMKSTHFTGCSFSSFSMNIAIKRHTMMEGVRTRQWRSPGDVYSTLVGRFENWYEDWMFMYDCMWG